MNMIPRKRKNKLNQKTLDSLKEPGTYFFNDAPGIAVRVSKNQKKSFYGSYSISKGVNAEGRITSTGRYKYISRVGEFAISSVRETVTNNIKKWKAETTTGKGDDVAALAKDFRLNALNGYRVRKKGSKIKYKETTKRSMTTLLKTYVEQDTKDPEIIERLTGKAKINGSWNADVLGKIKLDKLTKQHIKDFHERLADTPYIANRVIAALSTVFTWDANRTNPMFEKDHNPCLGISKFEEKKDKRHIPTSKVLQITSYIENNLWRDPHPLAFYSTGLELGERQSDGHGLAWRKPDTITEQLKCTGWIVSLDTGEVYLRDSKDRSEATIYLTEQGIKTLKKLWELVSSDDTNASWAVGSMYIFPRKTDPTKHVNFSSYRKFVEKFHFKMGLAERTLVRAKKTRKLYKYKNHFNLKHLRKTYVTTFGNTYGLQAASERMRHSSVKVTKDHYWSADAKKYKVKNLYDAGENVVQLKKVGAND